MVFPSNETLVLNPEDIAFDDFVPGLIPLHDDDQHWIPASVLHDEDEDDEDLADDEDAFAHFTETFDDHDGMDGLWGQSHHDSPFEVEDLDRILSSGSSSPSNQELDSGSSSDSESTAPASKPSLKRAVKASKNNYSTDDDDNDFKIKKSKSKKGSVTKPISKQARRIQDESTMKLINQLRTESGDHPDSRRRIHNVLERKRRNDLKFCYQELRESIPDLETTDRAPTGMILARAAEYIQMLQEEEKKIEAGLAAARQEHELLRRQLGLN